MKKGNSFSERRITMDESKPYTWHQIWNMDFLGMHWMLWCMGTSYFIEGVVHVWGVLSGTLLINSASIEKTFFFNLAQKKRFNEVVGLGTQLIMNDIPVGRGRPQDERARRETK